MEIYRKLFFACTGLLLGLILFIFYIATSLDITYPYPNIRNKTKGFGRDIRQSQLSNHSSVEALYEQSVFHPTKRLQGFLDILKPYHDTLNRIRLDIITAKNNTLKKPRIVDFSNYNKLRMRDTNYFTNIFKTRFQTLQLYSDLAALTPLLTKKYTSAANDILAKNASKSMIHAQFRNNQTVDFSVTDFTSGVPDNFPQKDTKILLSFITIARNSFVTDIGAVFGDGMWLEPGGCKPSNPSKPKVLTSRVLREVFTIAQYWGEGYFHAFVEDVSRLPAYISFLREHEEIYVHVVSVNSFTVKLLERLGIQRTRLVSGHVYADVVYMPDGTHCGTISLVKAQLTGLHYRSTLPELTTNTRRSLILIRRRSKRWLKRHDDIAKVLERLAPSYGLDFVIFDDSHIPPFEETMKLFQRAKIGPHGAGLSNLIFAQPGTIVVEVLCKPSNLCYQNLALYLGHSYHGFTSRTDSCLNTTPEEIETVVTRALV